MKSTLRRLTQTLLLLAVGVALYFVLPVASQLTENVATVSAPLQPLAVVEVEGAQAPDTAGNIVLQNCLAAIERRTSISADVIQSATIAGQRMATSGGYLQQGRADRRQYSLLLQGRIGPTTTRLWQVCTGRWLWTDLAWDGTGGAGKDAGRRTVKGIDLGLVREKLKRDGYSGEDLSPGQARAEMIHPELWSGMGGLPMLVGALNENFNFGTPRQMSLRNKRVYATVGHWKPDRLAKLLRKPTSEEESHADKEESQTATAELQLPDRMPHHVLVAIGADDLFPHLIEYRSGSDSLSVANLQEDALFRESQTPLMKLDFMQVRFNTPIPPDRFVYNPPEGGNWHDATDKRVTQIQRRLRVKQMANRSTRSLGQGSTNGPPTGRATSYSR